MSKNNNKPLVALDGLVAEAVTLPPATWIAYSKLSIDHNLPLPDAIPATRTRYNSQAAGNLSYYHDKSGSGRPLLLIHSVNAAASAYEMRPLFEHYRGQRHR